MNDQESISLEQWIFGSPAEDFEYIGTEVETELLAAIDKVRDVCQKHGIPHSMIFCMGMRSNGRESRYTASSHMMPLERVCPEVLVGSMLGSMGVRGIIEGSAQINSALVGRGLFLEKLNEELVKKS